MTREAPKTSQAQLTDLISQKTYLKGQVMLAE